MAEVSLKVLRGEFLGGQCKYESEESRPFKKPAHRNFVTYLFGIENNQTLSTRDLLVSPPAQNYFENICNISLCMQQVLYTKEGDDSKNK